jgi:hypothetical protein
MVQSAHVDEQVLPIFKMTLDGGYAIFYIISLRMEDPAADKHRQVDV